MKIWFRFDLRNEYTDYQKKIIFFSFKEVYSENLSLFKI